MATLPDFATLPVTHQTDKVGPGTIFVAIKGMREDGMRYIPEAIARGASEIIIAVDAQIDPEIEHYCVEQYIPITRVPEPRAALASLSAALHGYPARQLRFIGITGTKGKTTTSFLLYHILHHAGRRVALLSTVENRIMDQRYETELTTQHPDYLHAFFNRCVEQHIEFVVMEVAAQALSLHRVDGIQFERALWLNFGHEHGEFYSTPELYWQAKASLFDQIMPHGMAFVPRDDIRISSLPMRSDIQKIFIVPGQSEQDVAQRISPHVVCRYGQHVYRCKNLLGEHNRYNVCAAIVTALSLEIPVATIQDALHTFPGVPGRLNWYVLCNGVMGCIDYAHNPASFQATLSTVRQYTHQLIVVFGAGGDRDATRRPLMGRCAAEFADYIYLTTDNPRSEDPAHICEDIRKGIAPEYLSRVCIELDRTVAIQKAVAQASPGAIVLLLGKGPEEYQLIKGVKHPFSEREILTSLAI